MRRILVLCFLLGLHAQQDLLVEGAKKYAEHQYTDSLRIFQQALKQAGATGIKRKTPTRRRVPRK